MDAIAAAAAIFLAAEFCVVAARVARAQNFLAVASVLAQNLQRNVPGVGAVVLLASASVCVD